MGSRYDAVLVDEFQDTDAEQYGIFRKAFIENARQSSFLCFVGDPKQSIYRFRHADVFVYAKAKNEIEPRNRWTISKNYRSTPELLNVVNHIFGLPNVFRTKNFTYENVESGGSKPGLMQEDKRVPAVTLYEAGEKKNSANFSKNYERNLARVVTKRIVEFLDSDNGYRLEDRPVRASDIAILVYTNNQIDLIRSELAENGIAANAKTQHSIFDTDEYAQIKMLLEGIIHCDNLKYVKGALTTDFFLASGAASPIQEQALDEVLTAFASYKDIWLKQGAGYLLEYLMREKHLRRYLFALPEGQRSVVNWEHLTEVLYELDENHGSPEALLSQLVALSQVKTRDAEADTAELLRMQQDDNVVTILTYHASKGLQFPIVFLPYFGDVFQKERKLQKAAIHSYYDQDGFKHYFPGFLRNDNSTGPSLEIAAESVRVTYVAMTRAISHLEVIDMQDQPEKSFGLALTISEKNVWDSLENKDALLINRVKIEDMFLKTSQPLKVTRDRLSAREGAKPIYPDWAETSYSALVRKTDASAEEAAEAVRRDDANLVDSDIRETNETLKELEELGLTRDDIVFFPRGASAGEALHAVLEKIDLTQPQSWEKVAQRALEVYYPKDSVQRFLPGVLSFLERLAQTPMVGKTTLQGVPFSETIREMPFYLRADQTGIGNRLSDAMRQTGKKGFDITPLAAGAQVAGYIKGFIDFIFRIEGRYYIIDWKSNFLNTARVYQTADDFFAEAYGRDSMAQAMEHHAYTLQYAIYTVALVRYLRARLGESFDYERHVGGIRYVFLRGVRSGLDGVGVWEDRLDENFVKQLDRLFGG
ncbi:MAG TPA: hypothetical protein DCW60_02605 [Sutterella sp.]|nr:hypothetical protein [Sutterella sp.]